MNRPNSQYQNKKFEGQNKCPLRPGKAVVIKKLILSMGQVTRNFYDYFKTPAYKAEANQLNIT